MRARDTIRAAKVVVACGLGIPFLALMVGLHAPVHPVRGQMIESVTVQTAAQGC